MLKNASNNIMTFTLFMLISIIAACSGGSGGSTSGTTSIGGAGGTTTPATNAVVTFVNANVQLNGNTLVTATFRNADGTPAVGAAVSLSTTLGTLSATTGTTNGNGAVTTTLTAGTTSGQGQVTASSTINGKQVTSSGLFTVTLPPLHLGPLTADLLTLSNGGTANFTVQVLDVGNAVYTAQEVDVVFTSTQTTAGNATINSPVRTVNGIASTTYKAGAFSGGDTITATLDNSSVQATISVSPKNVGSIIFVSASPTNLALQGMGGLGYALQSVVTFRVLDTSGQPSANQPVTFSLSTTVGGIVLTQLSGSTDASGNVSTIVQSGTVATPVRVKATITGSNPAISTQSDQLTISTGLPAQNGMSVAFTTLNSESYNIDGVEVPVTVYLADHFGNPVPDGTAVSFSAQSGSISPNCLTGTGGSPHGACVVKWTSSGLRTVDGKNAILVYAIGEESFIDLNGNGLADGTCSGGSLLSNLTCGEFTDTLQAWRDDAHTGVYDILSDPFIDFNGSGKVDRNAVFNGVLTTTPATLPLKHVFANPVIIMSGSGAVITVSSAGTISTNPAVITFKITDVRGRVMPAGTKVDLTTNVGSLSSAGYIVPNTTSDPGNNAVVWSVPPNVPAKLVTGSVTISVTSPGGTNTSYSIPVSGTF